MPDEEAWLTEERLGTKVYQDQVSMLLCAFVLPCQGAYSIELCSFPILVRACACPSLCPRLGTVQIEASAGPVKLMISPQLTSKRERNR